MNEIPSFTFTCQKCEIINLQTNPSEESNSINYRIKALTNLPVKEHEKNFKIHSYYSSKLQHRKLIQ